MNVNTISNSSLSNPNDLFSYAPTSVTLITAAVGLAIILGIGLAFRERPNHEDNSFGPQQHSVERFPPSRQLQYACLDGELHVFRRILRSGADPEDAVLAAIHCHSQSHGLDYINAAIDAGANIHNPDATWVHFAVKGELDMLQFLLEKGVDPNKAQSIYYRVHAPKRLVTPLQWIFSSDAENRQLTDQEKETRIQLLLQHGAKIDLPTDENGNTILHLEGWYIGNSQFSIIFLINSYQEYVARQATPRVLRDRQTGVCSSNGRAYQRNPLFAHQTPFNCRNNVGDTPLHQAARRGALNLARKLVGVGANLDILNDAGETPRQILQAHGALQQVLS